MLTRRERIEGGLIGLLVGDALGVPYEFRSPEQLPEADAIEFRPPEGFRPTHGVPPGTWSDDGALALALLDSLLSRGRLELEDLGRRFLAWRSEGAYAVDGRVFDIGIQTARSLDRLAEGVPPLEAGRALERDNGNGSLMRVLPLALWHDGPDAELVSDACLQSRLTHGHPRSQACCALYCLWARGTLEGSADPWSDAVARFRAAAADRAGLLAELEKEIRPDRPPEGQGSGYVVDCLHSARLALEAGPYEAAVKAAVKLGRDTDTTACVAGGIAGLRDGHGAIPARWVEALRGREILDPLRAALLARVG